MPGKNAVKPKEGAELSDPNSVKEGIGDLKAEADRQEDEAQRYAVAFLQKVMRLKGVAIERDHFLRSEFRKRGVADERVELAISTSPAAAGMDSDLVDSIARDVIDFETKKSTVLSFSAGLPGGLAMLGTIPADVTQYYVHAFRIMQKLAYLYGWQSFIDDCDEMDDETLAAFALLLAVMAGVSGPNSALTAFSKTVQANVAKKVANKALMQTSYYPIIKKDQKGPCRDRRQDHQKQFRRRGEQSRSGRRWVHLGRPYVRQPQGRVQETCRGAQVIATGDRPLDRSGG